MVFLETQLGKIPMFGCAHYSHELDKSQVGAVKTRPCSCYLPPVSSRFPAQHPLCRKLAATYSAEQSGANFPPLSASPYCAFNKVLCLLEVGHRFCRPVFGDIVLDHFPAVSGTADFLPIAASGSIRELLTQFHNVPTYFAAATN